MYDEKSAIQSFIHILLSVSSVCVRVQQPVLRIHFDHKYSCSTFSRDVNLLRALDYKSLSEIALVCILDFMSCSVALEVMPHSATSRASGDDISTITSWKLGA